MRHELRKIWGLNSIFLRKSKAQVKNLVPYKKKRSVIQYFDVMYWWIFCLKNSSYSQSLYSIHISTSPHLILWAWTLGICAHRVDYQILSTSINMCAWSLSVIARLPYSFRGPPQGPGPRAPKLLRMALHDIF